MRTITCCDLAKLQELVELHNKILALIDDGVIAVVHQETKDKEGTEHARTDEEK
jgi:hypothetical protein